MGVSAADTDVMNTNDTQLWYIQFSIVLGYTSVTDVATILICIIPDCV